MKILHITSHLNTGGITTYLLTLIKEQKKAGHEVSIWSSPGTCRDAFRECCAEVVCDVPRCKSELSPRLWAQLPGLTSFLKSRVIQIIHTHTRVGQVLATAATRFIDIPHVSTAHMFYKRRLGRRLFPCWGKTVIAISQTMQQGLVDIFGAENLPPIKVVTNGIDIFGLQSRVDKVDRHVARGKYGYTQDHIVILALSRQIPVKGTHILIEAFAIAHQQIPKLRLLIAGAGDEDYLAQLREQVQRLKLQDVVVFIGNEPAIEEPFKAADIYAAPFMWPEAFGLSILEAMAAGLPVIGSDSGGISELLGRGSYGLLFQEAHVPELVRCLITYAKDPDLRRKMSAAAKQVSSDYSSEKMCRQIQEVYEEVLEAKR
ncbi:MAG TPA: glycosyltransferase family 4 protein [Candidatus Omnitrophota bacterium]|nr:glycosyltransferase family 4 protein [Candidatus Omnitrophota bacterium]